MIKVLWVCNTYTTDVATKKNISVPKVGGWLTGLSASLKYNSEISLVFCYPVVGIQEQDDFVIDGIHYYSFYSPKLFGVLNVESDKEVPLKRKQIANILDKEKPDLVHIFGTEYVHALIAAEEACKRTIETVCSIQGLISVYQGRYLDYVPCEYWHKTNVSCLLRGTLYSQMKKMSRRSDNEISTIKLCRHIIGRTEWDRIHTYFINKKRKYYFCNETLRDEFYTAEWNYENCKKHSIFISQGSSPIKGINNVLIAVGLLRDEFEDIELYIAGNDFVSNSGIINKIKRSTYAEYILSLINKYHLNPCVHFTGALDAKGMVEYYLKSNVFISPSTIENSSNSIGEAMLLGVPVIASNVGGTCSMLSDKTEGFLYEGKDICFLADRIKQVFLNTDETIAMANRARSRAQKTFDKIANQEQLVAIYKKIVNTTKD